MRKIVFSSYLSMVTTPLAITEICHFKKISDFSPLCFFFNFNYILSLQHWHHQPEQHCQHSFPTVAEELPFVRLDKKTGGSGPRRRTKRSPEHKLRIKVFYHESVRKLDRKKRDIVKLKV